MSVAVSTAQPQPLLNAIYKAIDDKHIVTWRYMDHQGVRYLTHSAQQWDAKAWFKSTYTANGLVFNIVPPQKTNISSEVYAIFHGRLIEMLLAHFDKQFGNASASALPVTGDQVKAA